MSITFDQARTLADAALAHARELGVSVSVSVVNDRGHELVTLHMDGAMWPTPGIARTKAQTAAVFMRPTAVLAELTAKYPVIETQYQAQVGFPLNTLPGGLPIERDGVVVGGIGVSGASTAQDIACCERALDVSS